MTDRADELAQQLIPEHAKKIMVDRAGGDRRVYSADEAMTFARWLLDMFGEEEKR